MRAIIQIFLILLFYPSQLLADAAIATAADAQHEQAEIKIRELLFNTLFITTLVALVVGIFLYAGGVKHTRKRGWLQPGTVRALIWLLATVLVVISDAAVILLAGLSHSSYPYDSVNNFMFQVLVGYLVLGILVRGVNYVYAKSSKEVDA